MVRPGATSSRSSSAPVDWCWLGRVHHDRTTALQEDLRDALLEGQGTEALLLCEHDPVVTLGRRALPEHLLIDEVDFAMRGIDLRPVSRGGEVTYHGPGQLVAYPVLRLRRGVLAHVQGMAAAVIDLLADYGVEGRWHRERPGVWVEGAKICALGIHVRRGVAIHGLAFNVALPAESFAPIVACGQPGAAVTSLHELRGVPLVSAEADGLSPAHLAPRLAAQLARHLEIQLQPRSADAFVRVQFPDCKSDRHR